MLTDAMLMTLVRKGLVTVDQHRRTMEDFPPEQYGELGYYQRWLTAIEALLVEKQLVTREEIEAVVEGRDA